ncbi:unnamed protein product [Leptidea sinapis]|uniref:Uncharacterized protein n=1 Tax=Leptidea sinapis TaxID=189913 RepID=A0A5E4R583_9NEOP|nr:unnamed protein product [Leptidea sinapis]
MLYGSSKDFVVGEGSVSNNERELNGEGFVSDENTDTEQGLEMINNGVNDEDCDIAYGIQSGNESAYDDAEIPLTEIEHGGIITLRNRGNLRPPNRYRDYFMVTGDVYAELHQDSESAICLAHDSPYERHQRAKHIQIRHFFVRECVTTGSLKVLKVDAAKQLADFLTKPLFKPRIKELSTLIGLA